MTSKLVFVIFNTRLSYMKERYSFNEIEWTSDPANAQRFDSKNAALIELNVRYSHPEDMLVYPTGAYRIEPLYLVLDKEGQIE